MRLTGIDANGDQGLIFQFDDNGVRRDWTFEPASLAEFMALLVDGGVRDGGKLELPPAAVALTAHANQPAHLTISLPRLDMSLPLSDAQLKMLRDAIERRLVAGNAPQQGGVSGGQLQIVTEITSRPKRRRTGLN